MAEVDLHMHTTRSDGQLTPTALVELLARNGVKVAAITDHDSTSGLDEALAAAQAYPQLRIIPGVEISTDVEGGEIHILAYHVDRNDAGFQQVLERFRAARYDRGRRMLEKLAELGMPLEWERVLEIAGDASIGRPHVARALIEKGYVASNQEAFDKYLGRNGPAYADREKLTPEQAIAMALENGALPVLAHPIYVNNLEKILPSLVSAGLVGMEVYYGKNQGNDFDRLLHMAIEHKLIPLGGSDYHGVGYEGEVMPGTVGPPMENLRRLEALKRGAALN